MESEAVCFPLGSISSRQPKTSHQSVQLVTLFCKWVTTALIQLTSDAQVVLFLSCRLANSSSPFLKSDQTSWSDTQAEWESHWLLDENLC